jgi:hypothetical protein
MKKVLSIIIVLLWAASAAFAQNSSIRQRLDVVEIGPEEGPVTVAVFKMADNGQYYLTVGRLGIGDDFIQLNIDPLSELFIPIGNTLAESQQTLEKIISWFKLEPNTANELDGCLGIMYPDDTTEKVTVTYRKLVVSNLLEFSIARGNLLRATHIHKSDLNSLLSSLKIYRSLHPKEQ